MKAAGRSCSYLRPTVTLPYLRPASSPDLPHTCLYTAQPLGALCLPRGLSVCLLVCLTAPCSLYLVAYLTSHQSSCLCSFLPVAPWPMFQGVYLFLYTVLYQHEKPISCFVFHHTYIYISKVISVSLFFVPCAASFPHFLF